MRIAKGVPDDITVLPETGSPAPKRQNCEIRFESWILPENASFIMFYYTSREFEL